jgi:hypothetical protein
MHTEYSHDHYARLAKQFSGIQRFVHMLLYKHTDHNKTARLKLLWTLIKSNAINFRQFERLLVLINKPELVYDKQ